MNIGVDIDDVLADFGVNFVDFLNNNYKTSLKKEDIFDFKYEIVLKIPREEVKKRFDEFYKTNHFVNISPLNGSKESISKLDKSHNLIAVTSRPEALSKKTQDWISLHFPDKFKEIHFTNKATKKKVDICKQKNIHLFIEDNLEYANEIAEAGIIVFLMDCPWNKCDREKMHENILRVHSWDEIYNKIKEMN